MPNGDFLNPRYKQENMFKTDKELYDKYGYVPRPNSDDYDCKQDYDDAMQSYRRYNDEQPRRGGTN